MSSTELETNEEIARAYPERVATEKDLELLERLLTEDFVEHGPFGDENGIAEARAGMERLFEAFPDFTATVEDLVASGDTVAMRVTVRATHEGPFAGVAPTGNTVEVQNMVFTRIEGGRIAERWVVPDTLSMLQQLGAVDVELQRP